MKLFLRNVLLIVGTMAVLSRCDEYAKNRFQRYYIKSAKMNQLSTVREYSVLGMVLGYTRTVRYTARW